MLASRGRPLHFDSFNIRLSTPDPPRSGDRVAVDDVDPAHRAVSGLLGYPYPGLYLCDPPRAEYLAEPARSSSAPTGLVDEIRIQLAPVCRGTGARLFEDLGAELVSTGVTGRSAVTRLRFDLAGC